MKIMIIFNKKVIKLRLKLFGDRCHSFKNGKETSEDTEESPAECAGECKQNKGN